MSLFRNLFARPDQTATAASTDAADPATDYVDGRPDEDDLVVVETDLRQLGHRMARFAGRRSSIEEELDSVQLLADEAAAAQGAAPFEPDHSFADRLAQDEYERDLLERQPLVQQVEHARADLRERRAELAALAPEPEPPRLNWLFPVLAAAAISVTLALTLHDLVFARMFSASGGSSKALVFSLLCGALLGAIPAGHAFYSASYPDSKRWLAEAVGRILVVTLFATSLLVLRLGVAESEAGKMLAWGFAILEFSLGGFLELFALGLRRRWQQFRADNTDWCAADQAVAMAELHVAERRSDLARHEARLAQHLERVRRREHLVRAAPARRAAARAAAHEGYFRGLAENNGHLNGFASEPPTRASVQARTRQVRIDNVPSNGAGRPINERVDPDPYPT